MADSSDGTPDKKRRKLDLNENHEEGSEQASLGEEESDDTELISTVNIHKSRPPVSAPQTNPSHAENTLAGTKKSLKPNSTGSISAQRSSNKLSLEQKASSSKGTAASESAEGEMTQVCPICNKTLQADNRGLNAHIDFCLSRGAIREAQAEGEGSGKKQSESKNQNKKEGFNWFMKDPGKGKGHKGR
jgi:DNA polymerase kappa